MFSTNNKLTIMEPSQVNLDHILIQAKKIGQEDLSQTDIHLLALCLEFEKPVLITDDYDVRNYARFLNIESKGCNNKQRRISRKL